MTATANLQFFENRASSSTIVFMVEIVQNGDPVLRQKAKEVPLSDIGTPKLRKILRHMAKALDSQDDGVAIAAPQIGVSLRIFLVSKAALTMPEKLEERVDMEDRRKAKRAAGYLTFINPVLTKLSREKAALDEGCLSVRPLYGKVRRAKKASVKALDERGAPFQRGASGLLAQIFQHETDHLDGILFIDKATNLKEAPQGTSDH